jgi:hypothetical protein
MIAAGLAGVEGSQEPGRNMPPSGQQASMSVKDSLTGILKMSHYLPTIHNP